jgi:hypothetical protein
VRRSRILAIQFRQIAPEIAETVSATLPQSIFERISAEVLFGSRAVNLEVSTYRPVALRQQTFDSGSQERIKPRLAAIEVKTDGGHSPPQWLGSHTGFRGFPDVVE